MKLYLDTSVFGGYFDKEFEEFTKPLFHEVFMGDHHIVFSDISEQELKFAPERIKDLINSIPKRHSTYVESNQESLALAEFYIKNGVVGKTSITDCLHISLATIHEVDVLISWNFKHIVNVVKIVGYNSVNKVFGYKKIDIRTPREILKNE